MILPYFVGGLLPGIVASIAFYYLMRPLVAAYQKARRGRAARPRGQRATGADGAARTAL